MTDPLTAIREWVQTTMENISGEDSGHANGYRDAARDVLAILNIAEAEHAVATEPTLAAVLHKEHANDWDLSCPLCAKEIQEMLDQEKEE